MIEAPLQKGRRKPGALPPQMMSTTPQGNPSEGVLATLKGAAPW